MGEGWGLGGRSNLKSVVTNVELQIMWASHLTSH